MSFFKTRLAEHRRPAVYSSIKDEVLALWSSWELVQDPETKARILELDPSGKIILDQIELELKRPSGIMSREVIDKIKSSVNAKIIIPECG